MTIKGQKVSKLSNNVSLGKIPVQAFSSYTPALSLKLIKKCTMAHTVFEATSRNLCQKVCLSFSSLPSLQFLSLFFHNGPLAIIRT